MLSLFFQNLKPLNSRGGGESTHQNDEIILYFFNFVVHIVLPFILFCLFFKLFELVSDNKYNICLYENAKKNYKKHIIFNANSINFVSLIRQKLFSY